MTKDTHTPGPWAYRERKVGHHTRLPFVVASESPEEVLGVVADVTDEADARLIAAAPDLLAVVRDFMDYMQKDGDWSENDALYRATEIALARAEGR